jgi:3-hydroxybutyryl-CoA dehydratase
MTVYLEDLEPGQQLQSAGRTITDADILAFAGVSGDFNELHTNEEWVKANTPFSGRIAHGLLILGIASGLRNAVLDQLFVIAYLNVERAFTGPTYVGDTISARWTVGDIRESRSRPEAGIVRLDCEVAKSDGTVVQHGADVCLIGRRPQEG